MDPKRADDLVRRLAAALRGAELYSPNRPLVLRSLDGLTAAAGDALKISPSVVIGFIGDEVVVNSVRLQRGSAALGGFARGLREREIEKITLSQGLTREEISGLMDALGERESPIPLSDRLVSRGVRH